MRGKALRHGGTEARRGPGDDVPPTHAPSALIIGCGRLGVRVARELRFRGARVFGTTRRRDRAAALTGMGVEALRLTLGDRPPAEALGPALATGEIDVYCLLPPLPPDAPGTASPGRGLDGLLVALQGVAVHRAVLVSSTVVYGRHDGRPVSADTPPVPGDERGRRQIETEHRWLAAGPHARVLRLAGLYGPGRLPGLAALQQGAPIVGDPHALLNLVHVHDAAMLLTAVAGQAGAGAVELGSDGSPVPRIAYYRALATRLGAPAPTMIDGREAARRGLDVPRPSAGKACDPNPTMRRTGWRPLYPDYMAGLNAILPPRAEG